MRRSCMGFRSTSRRFRRSCRFLLRCKCKLRKRPDAPPLRPHLHPQYPRHLLPRSGQTFARRRWRRYVRCGARLKHPRSKKHQRLKHPRPRNLCPCQPHRSRARLLNPLKCRLPAWIRAAPSRLRRRLRLAVLRIRWWRFQRLHSRLPQPGPIPARPMPRWTPRFRRLLRRPNIPRRRAGKNAWGAHCWRFSCVRTALRGRSSCWRLPAIPTWIAPQLNHSSNGVLSSLAAPPRRPGTSTLFVLR